MSTRLVLYFFLALIVFGCAKETKEETAAVDDLSTAAPKSTGEEAGGTAAVAYAIGEEAGDTGTEGDGTGAEGDGAGAEGDGADDSAQGGESSLDSTLSGRVIYFEYDSSEVLPQYRSVVEENAAYLAGNPNAVATLEGHADERGTREYNLALGERRAFAVKSQMTLLGAGDNQIKVVSYGEERPALEGHDEGAWSKNRRVEILY